MHVLLTLANITPLLIKTSACCCWTVFIPVSCLIHLSDACLSANQLVKRLNKTLLQYCSAWWHSMHIHQRPNCADVPLRNYSLTALTANFTDPVKYTWSVRWLSFGGLWVSLTGHCVESACALVCVHTRPCCTHTLVEANDGRLQITTVIVL